MSQLFLTGKNALSDIVQDGQNYSNNQSEMYPCAHLGQQSKQAIDWFDLSSNFQLKCLDSGRVIIAGWTSQLDVWLLN